MLASRWFLFYFLNTYCNTSFYKQALRVHYFTRIQFQYWSQHKLLRKINDNIYKMFSMIGGIKKTLNNCYFYLISWGKKIRNKTFLNLVQVLHLWKKNYNEGNLDQILINDKLCLLPSVGFFPMTLYSYSCG